MKVIQVRNVPDEVHAQLRERAAAAGVSLSDYVLEELRDIARRSHNAEVLLRAAERPGRPGRHTVSHEDIVAAIRSGRDE